MAGGCAGDGGADRGGAGGAGAGGRAAVSGIGHNGGPPLEERIDPAAVSWHGWAWRRAHKRAWKTPPPEIALRRLARAEALGMSYKEYTLEILERGTYL